MIDVVMAFVTIINIKQINVLFVGGGTQTDHFILTAQSSNIERGHFLSFWLYIDIFQFHFTCYCQLIQANAIFHKQTNLKYDSHFTNEISKVAH